MDISLALLLIGVPFIILLAVGMPVGFTFLFIMLSSSYVLMGPMVGPYATISSFLDSIGVFSLAPVPLFILMGEVLLQTGLATQSLDALSKLLGKIPARLAILATMGGALFGMLSGSTMASTAMLGSSLVPEMRRRGYSKAMSIGPVLASGGLAMIIPPSSLAVIYGTTAKIPIGRLLLAGLIPGIIMALNYTINILVRVKLNPSLAPPYDPEVVPFREKIRLLVVDLLPMTFIVFLVTGIFILGIATPTEAAALGAIGTIVVSMFYRKMNFGILVKSVKGTVVVTTMTLFIIGGSQIFSQLLAYTGVTQQVVQMLTQMEYSPYIMLLIMMGIIIVLGTFMESVPIIMITVPIFVPVATALGFNQIWFGVIMLICMQIGMTTPPFGLLLFVMKGCVGSSMGEEEVTMGDMVRAAFPFLISDTISVLLVILFPILALWLPNMLM